MKVRDIMTADPACVTPETSLQETARLMVEEDCGAVPVIEAGSGRPIGVITDRDITCRMVAEGRNPLQASVRDCMTATAITIGADADLDECVRLMEEHKIRRCLVVDDSGKVCGIVAQADLAQRDPDRAGEAVEAISQPTEEPATLH